MVYYIPYTWYIIYPIHGILYTLYMAYYIPYTWYIIYPIHGLLYTLYMVYYINDPLDGILYGILYTFDHFQI